MAGSEEDETGEVKQSESSWAIMTEQEDLEAAAAACAIAGTSKSARKNTAGVAEAVMAATVAVSQPTHPLAASNCALRTIMLKYQQPTLAVTSICRS